MYLWLSYNDSHNIFLCKHFLNLRDHRGHDSMVVGFTTAYAIIAYYH